MAEIFKPTDDQVKGWNEWVNTLPKNVKKVAKKFNPWTLYRIKSNDKRVTLHSFADDGTVTVNILAEFNLTLFERSVLGIDPNDLEPCALPDPKEITGAMLSQTEVDQNIDAIRFMIRPDLWTIGDDGKAYRLN
jgi:hypothetical protein